MIPLICIVLLFPLLISPSLLIEAADNLTLCYQHPNPEAVVQEVQRRILSSTSNVKVNDQLSCITGNPIDDCWQCDPNWANDRQHLADCSIGFGQGAIGGKGGQIYVVTDSSDNDVADPKPGTLRFAVIQVEPLWIVFSANMQIKLSHQLIVSSFKTIDGRGANVYVTGKGCITVQDVSNVIIHNIHVYNCVPSGSAAIRVSPTQVEHKGKSDGDGISIHHSRNIWVDHCAVSHCTDGLIDVTEGSTAVTISNNYFSHHDKVMLLGHSDNFMLDKGMQVTIAFNHFGVQLVQRMPRCRHGYFHVVNNDYTEWKMYAIGGSAAPTIISEGNRYVAPNDASSKQVTKRLDGDQGDWAGWEWRSDGDLMVNGAYFLPSGQGLNNLYAKDSGAEPKSAAMIDKLTFSAGVLGGPRDNGDQISQNRGTNSDENGGSGDRTFGNYGSGGEGINYGNGGIAFGSGGEQLLSTANIILSLLIILTFQIIASYVQH
ncbi:Pectate lyase [Heracleum sosnowskyi]|uniref:Pectate lyase n=1 Tax=Heracleum sosnowskyi TaxID=360622 RepID=A0AAD8GXH6_9APIA|nr:Pectate lyase [Heracleum sosnowskyi]